MHSFRAFANSPRGELTLLFAASCAVVSVLFLTVAAGAHSAPGLSTASLRHLLLVLLVLGLSIAGAVLLGLPQRLFASLTLPPPEVSVLREDLKTAQAVINAEAQVIVLWQRGERVRVVVHSLRGIPGLPTDQATIERFGQWLDQSSAAALKAALDALFAAGTPFNILVRTLAGAHLEADGRAAGTNAMLRLRDTTGHRRDLARILDKHRDMTRDIAAARVLLNALPMPAWTTNAVGQINWANPSYIAAVGADGLGDVTGRPADLLDQRPRETALATVARNAAFRERLPLVAAGRMHAHDVMMLPADGGAVGIAIDVGAIEDAREDAERRTVAYDRTLHRVATGVAIFGRDGRLSFFNDAYRAIWELDTEWLAQKPTVEEILDRLRGLSRLPQVANYRDWKAKVLACARDGADYEDWWHLLDGRHIHVTAEKSSGGGVTFLFDDKTQRLTLESRFNAMIDTQRETLDSLKEGVAVFSPDGRLQLSNKAFAQVWKLTRGMLAEGPHLDAIIAQARQIHDDAALWTEMTRAVTSISDRRQSISGQFVRADGNVIDYTIAPLPDGATLVTFSDVTDVRRAERALKERNEALVAADRLKSQFIRHVSYELRTPLQTIIGYTDLMQIPAVGELNGRQREFLGDIEASSKSLLSVINDILDLATIDAGGLELKVAPVDVRPVVDAALVGIKDRARLMNVGIDVEIKADARHFVADDKRVKQVLYNLLSNAIGFSKAGDRVKIQASRERGMLAFTVEDRGIGVPQDLQANVFDRFESRSHGSTHRGAGLGLAIVKSLVELHGGNVAFVSEPGRGTRVTVRFPEAGVGARLAHKDAA